MGFVARNVSHPSCPDGKHDAMAPHEQGGKRRHEVRSRALATPRTHVSHGRQHCLSMRQVGDRQASPDLTKSEIKDRDSEIRNQKRIDQQERRKQSKRLNRQALSEFKLGE